MWWLIIQRFTRCRNPFIGIFNGLHKKLTATARENRSDDMRAAEYGNGSNHPCYSIGLGITIATNFYPIF